jgi:hypothetical protein
MSDYRDVTPCEEVDVAHMIWFENNNDRRRVGIESSPNIGGSVRRRERVKKDNLSTRLDAGRGHGPLPAEASVPVGVVHTPNPKTRCDVSELVCHISDRI